MANLAEQQPELVEAMATEYEQNCHTVAAAAEDLQHQNLARLTLLQVNHGVELEKSTIHDMKLDLLVDFFCGDDPLLRHHLNFTFQQRLASLLGELEAQHPEEGGQNA